MCGGGNRRQNRRLRLWQNPSVRFLVTGNLGSHLSYLVYEIQIFEPIRTASNRIGKALRDAVKPAVNHCLMLREYSPGLSVNLFIQPADTSADTESEIQSSAFAQCLTTDLNCYRSRICVKFGVAVQHLSYSDQRMSAGGQ